MGATIGSVIATKNAVIPAAVGVDLGCGLVAQRWEGMTAADLPDDLAAMHSLIAETVPAGVGQGRAETETVHDEVLNSAPTDIDPRIQGRAAIQLGSLGSCLLYTSPSPRDRG